MFTFPDSLPTSILSSVFLQSGTWLSISSFKPLPFLDLKHLPLSTIASLHPPTTLSSSTTFLLRPRVPATDPTTSELVHFSTALRLGFRLDRGSSLLFILTKIEVNSPHLMVSPSCKANASCGGSLISLTNVPFEESRSRSIQLPDTDSDSIERCLVEIPASLMATELPRTMRPIRIVAPGGKSSVSPSRGPLTMMRVIEEDSIERK
uniref:Uncharacterized protein n=1 Tax=Cucumis sativus TaxID=3659 RepID=A0A0A0L790_CUCSA